MAISARLLTQGVRIFEHEVRLWDRMPAVGREFGSPDFERLMAEDQRDGSGDFDPMLKSPFPKER